MLRNSNLYFYFDENCVAVVCETWTDVGKTRKRREVAEERGDENEIKAKSLSTNIFTKNTKRLSTNYIFPTFSQKYEICLRMGIYPKE